MQLSLTQNRLDSLLSWRLELESELAELKSKTTRAQEEISLKQTQLNSILNLLKTESDQGKPGLPKSKLFDKGFIDAAYELLHSNANRNPLHYKSITDNLLAAGVYIPGENPYAYLLTNISRDKSRFQRVDRGMYALTEWGMPSLKQPTNSKFRQPPKGKSGASGRTRRR